MRSFSILMSTCALALSFTAMPSVAVNDAYSFASTDEVQVGHADLDHTRFRARIAPTVSAMSTMTTTVLHPSSTRRCSSGCTREVPPFPTTAT
mmetsp:Transcript_102136/g.292345  ORF Transcript_102136/g.292345 Transcript_102136/m.292345 type:complete len:93 (+) Transcript_102136:991-1269(+)